MTWDEAVKVNDDAARSAKRRASIIHYANEFLKDSKDFVTSDPELAEEMVAVAQSLLRVASRIPAVGREC